MQRTKKLLIIILLLGAFQAESQNVQTFLDRFKEKPFKLSGGISANQIVYGASGIENRREPYTYFLSGNLNLSVYGWNIPFSATYSNQDFQYQTLKLMPFNQYGVSPYYKWIKLHLGYRSMSFSPYSMNGRTFYGTGVELTPGIFRFSAMYGKLQNAVQPDTSGSQPAFKRMGYAFKAGIGKGNDFIDFIVFAAEDDRNSLDSIPVSSTLTPMQNLVFNVNASKVIIEKITLSVEFGSSALTRDLSSENTKENIPAFYRATDFLMPNKSSTAYKKAIKTAFAYIEDRYSVGMAYERVDPEYTTLGSYYFNNDFENLTVNAKANFFETKLNVAMNVGGQRNNLDNSKFSGTNRIVSSLNANYTPSAKLNLSANYSNFSSYTYIRSEFDEINQTNPYENLDTLNFTQLTQSAGLTMMYTLGDPADKEKRRSINMILNYQKAAEKQENMDNQNGGSDFYNGNISYMHSWVPSAFAVSASMAGNINTITDNKTVTIGPTASVSKMFFERTFRAMFSASYNQSFTNSISQSRVLSFRLTGNYSLKKKHNLGLSMILLNRNTEKSLESPNFTEFTGTLNYSYNFSIGSNDK